MRVASLWLLALVLSCSTAAAAELLPAVAAGEDVGGCLLFFGAYANGNMGDVVQSSTMQRLFTKVAPGTCIWHSHPSKEAPSKGFHEGEFFANHSAGLLPLGCDRESGEQVSRFKAFIIGGGGIFEAKHWPLDCQDFVDGLGNDLPVAIFGVGASWEANASVPIIRRANYLSGRDEKSVRELSALVGKLDNATSRPEDVDQVRDPVLSDRYFTDVDGKCWRRHESAKDAGPLCFVLPSASKENLQNLHYIYSTRIVRKGDVLLNVFPKHQAEIEAYPYPVPVEQVLNPARFATRLCDCRAVIASRLHGAIMALQVGVPTIAAWPAAHDNKVPDLMKDVLQLPDQFVLVDNTFSRGSLSRMVNAVRKSYSVEGRRDRVFEKLESIAMHTQRQSAHLLANVTHLQLGEGVDWWNSKSITGSFWDDAPKLAQGEKLTEAANAAAEARPRSVVDRKQTPPEEVEVLPAWRAQERTTWGLGGISPSSRAPRVVGGEFSCAGSMYVALAALAMIAVLGLPGLASRSRGESSIVLPPHVKRGASAVFVAGAAGAVSVDEEEAAPGEPAKFAAGSFLAGARQLSMSDVVFFGLNYIVWVVLAMGFNVCSKTYMRETRNPVALLAIQGWVGMAVLWIKNQSAAAASSRRSLTLCQSVAPSLSPRAPSSTVVGGPPVLLRASSSAGPSWAGKCGLREAKRLGPGVWQAALLHCCNAVLTSWSVLVGGVAATHALKALEPVAAVGFSRWLLGSSLPPGRAAAVVVIVLGLAILMLPLHMPQWAGGSAVPSNNAAILTASGQDLAFPAVITACACCTVALRNVLLKKPDPPPPPPPLGLLACSIVGAAMGSVALLVPWLPFSWEWAGESLLCTSGINAALCSVGYNLASFNLLSELSPVGHAVGNASKRVILFASGLFLLGEEGSLSPRQLAGASVAFVGLATYNLTTTGRIAMASTSPGSR